MAQLVGSTLPALWLELEAVGSGSAQHVDREPVLQGRTAAVTAEPVLSICGKTLLLSGLSCPPRLPLRFFQLAILARIAKLTLTEIRGSRRWS